MRAQTFATFLLAAALPALASSLSSDPELEFDSSPFSPSLFARDAPASPNTPQIVGYIDGDGNLIDASSLSALARRGELPDLTEMSLLEARAPISPGLIWKGVKAGAKLAKPAGKWLASKGGKVLNVVDKVSTPLWIASMFGGAKRDLAALVQDHIVRRGLEDLVQDHLARRSFEDLMESHMVARRALPVMLADGEGNNFVVDLGQAGGFGDDDEEEDSVTEAQKRDERVSRMRVVARAFQA